MTVLNNGEEEKYKVTREEIEALLKQAQIQEHVFWGKEMVVSYRLPSGFVISGKAACVSPEIFDAEVGRQVAYEDAVSQLWQLEGYRLQLELKKEERR